jgi:polar amino acid transport system substrate-binding protein
MPFKRHLNRLPLICCLLIACLHQTRLYAAEVLTVGWDHRPPYQWETTSGQLKGVDIDIARAVLVSAGFEPNFIKVPWKRLLKVSLRNGDIDVGLQASKTPARETFAYFSSVPFLPSDAALFTRLEDRKKFSTINSLADLAQLDVRIGVTIGTIYSAHYETLLKNRPFTENLVFNALDEQNINMLLSNRIDALIGGELAITYQLKERNDSDRASNLMYINDRNDHSTGGYFIFSKASMTKAQIHRLDHALIQLIEDGTIADIISQYQAGKAP